MRKNQKFIYVAAVALLLCGAMLLVFSSIRQNAVYFLNVAEAKELPKQYAKQIRLFGEVGQHDLKDETASLGVRFALHDKDDKNLTVPVVFRGAVPDSFKKGIEVILEGRFEQNGNFVAASLMTKCPSKYKPNAEGKLRPPDYKE